MTKRAGNSIVGSLQAALHREREAYSFLAAEVTKLRAENARLRDVIEELDEHFDDEVDVVDGPDGQPRPNDAMRWQQRIREALGKSLIP